MKRTFLKCKLHRATVTGADLEYEGSISICPELIEVSGLNPYERVEIYNITNGERLATYVIVGKAGEICLNGAAAWKAKAGDKVIIAAFCDLEPNEIAGHSPTVVLLAESNKVKSVSSESTLL